MHCKGTDCMYYMRVSIYIYIYIKRRKQEVGLRLLDYRVESEKTSGVLVISHNAPQACA